MRQPGKEPRDELVARLWVQGVIAGLAAGFDLFDVRGPTLGDEGVYRPWFDIATSNGAVVRVSFETMLTVHEPDEQVPT